jgi:hypothetical protein
MIAICTFVSASAALLVLMFIKSRERAGAERILPSFRDAMESHTEALVLWLDTHATPEALWDNCKHAGARVAHYVARGMARIAHSVEYQARTVVHKTSKRVRRDVHYLEEAFGGRLDS